MRGRERGEEGEQKGKRGEEKGKKRRKRYHAKIPQVRRRLKSPHSSQDYTLASEIINTIHKNLDSDAQDVTNKTH